MKTTKIINLYGGPSTGKSTSAAFLFYQFKKDASNVELVREYVKNWAWEKRHISAYDQVYFLGKQSRAESMLYGKVDWIITDSPVMMGAFYAQKYCPPLLAEGVRSATLALYNQAEKDGHRHIHVMLRRSKPYLAEGRYQTEAEARDLDSEVRRFLQDLKIPFVESDTSEEALANLLSELGHTA